MHNQIESIYAIKISKDISEYIFIVHELEKEYESMKAKGRHMDLLFLIDIRCTTVGQPIVLP